MALTVAFNTAETFNMEALADNGGTWTALGGLAGLTVNGDILKVGSNSISGRLDSGGGNDRGGIQITRGTALDFDDAGTVKGMVAFWLNMAGVSSDTVDTGGVTIRIGSDASNYHEWQCAKLTSTTEIPEYEGGWQRYVVFLENTPNTTVGTPTMSAADYFGIQFDTTTDIMGNIQNVFFDEMNHLTAAQVAAGDSAMEVIGSEVTDGDLLTEISEVTAVIDEGGLIQKAGIIQWNYSIRFGDVTTLSDTMDSKNEILVQPKHKGVNGGVFLEFVGNGTGTNSFDWGTEVGSGDTSLGVGGGAIIAVGLYGAKIIATDSNALVNLFGVNIDGMNGNTDTDPAIVWDQTNAQMTSCTIVNSGFIDHANGGEIRDGFVAASVEAAGIGAILIEDNPAGVEFRDMQLINNVHAIENERNGPATLDLRNIKFAGNTADLRHNGTGVLTVNISEGGDTPTTSIGGGGSVVINNNVTLTVTVRSAETGGTIQGVRVFIDDDPIALPSISQGETNSSGVHTDTFNFTSDKNVIVRARKRGLIPVSLSATITASGLSVPITMTTDIADAI